MSPAWSFALARLIGVVAIAVVVGYFLGQVSLTVNAVLAGYLALNYLRLYRLDRWLRKRRTEEPPDFYGVWGDIVALVMRIYRRKQFHKRRIVQLFREFRRMTTAMPDGVIVMSADREIQWFNRNAARLLSLRRKVDYGQRIDNLVRHPDFIRYLAAGDFSQPVVIRSTVDAGVHLALHVVAYGAGQQLLLVHDVTRQIRLEAMRKDFVANASHELRTPLTVITGYLDSLADDASIDQAWAGPIKDMRVQAQRMNAIIAALLELSRLEATDGEAPRDPVDVPAMLEGLYRSALSNGDRPHHVSLDLETADGLFGVAHEIESAFTNLLMNGLKYTPSDGSVRMRWWSDEEGAHFSVIDNGIGIPAEHIPRLTERFYRVDAGRSRDKGGSGLGLAIVKHALQRHGGWLDVQSMEGEGSTFTCHFPPQRVWHVGLRAVASA